MGSSRLLTSKERISTVKMSHLLPLLILCITLHQSLGLFFGNPISQCRSDSQCPSFGCSNCVDRFLIFCRQRERYTVSGRCLNKFRLFCNVGNFLRGGRRNQDCSYKECAECLASEDCTGYDQYCSGNNCRTR